MMRLPLNSLLFSAALLTGCGELSSDEMVEETIDIVQPAAPDKGAASLQPPSRVRTAPQTLRASSQRNTAAKGHPDTRPSETSQVPGRYPCPTKMCSSAD